jgi:dihydrolipoamide dehydrogenase
MSMRVGVIGAGPGGYIAAIRAAQLGAEVVVVEEEAIGGCCLNWGCIPTKTIKATADALEKFHRCHELGIDLDGSVRPNMERIMARKNEVISIMAEGIHKIFESHRIRFVLGNASIKDPKTLRVAPTGQKEEDIAVDKIIIASGSKPLNIPTLPFDGQSILSSSHALLMTEVPESILIVGGGVIGCEFASIFNALGAKVTVVEALSRLIGLPSVDEDSSASILRELKKQKIKTLLDKTVERTEIQNRRVSVTIGPSPFLKEVKERDKKPQIVEVEKVLVSVGRQSNAKALGLDRLGVAVDGKGWIVANERMETNIAGVYAIGDALGPAKIMLAHVASTEGIVAAENAFGNNRKMNYDVVPSAIFTSPEMANVGLTEPQARERGHDVRSDSFLFRALGKSQAIGEIAGQLKMISDAKTKKILGVHIVGPHATDLISEGTLAIQMGATVEDLAHTIHAHPTLAEIFAETSHKAMDACLHCLKE